MSMKPLIGKGFTTDFGFFHETKGTDNKNQVSWISEYVIGLRDAVVPVFGLKAQSPRAQGFSPVSKR
jgi:hypothetical protein